MCNDIRMHGAKKAPAKLELPNNPAFEPTHGTHIKTECNIAEYITINHMS